MSLTKIEYLLLLLEEECIETAHRASKAIRFGLADVQSLELGDNKSRLIQEYNDLLAVMEMLCMELDILSPRDAEQIRVKKEKIQKYMTYSVDVGALKPAFNKCAVRYGSRAATYKECGASSCIGTNFAECSTRQTPQTACPTGVSILDTPNAKQE